MKKSFELFFHGASFPVPKRSLFDFFDQHPELMTATRYEVSSRVALPVFQLFVKALEAETKISVTEENVASLSLLAKEFCLEDLGTECADLISTLRPDSIVVLADRISRLEQQVASQEPRFIRELKDSILLHERQLEFIISRISDIDASLSVLRASLRPANASPPVSLPQPPDPAPRIVISLSNDKQLDGIISYLSRKYDKNVHDESIVTITASSVYQEGRLYAVRNLADLEPGCTTGFSSADQPGQWVCWDFHEMRVIPMRYSLQSRYACFPKTWIAESSLDGVNWKTMHRPSENDDLKGKLAVASYPVSCEDECRFIRVTQLGVNHDRNNILSLTAFEVFGILIPNRQ
jgi:hypothetical protein